MRSDFDLWKEEIQDNLQRWGKNHDCKVELDVDSALARFFYERESWICRRTMDHTATAILQSIEKQEAGDE